MVRQFFVKSDFSTQKFRENDFMWKLFLSTFEIIFMIFFANLQLRHFMFFVVHLDRDRSMSESSNKSLGNLL